MLKSYNHKLTEPKLKMKHILRAALLPALFFLSNALLAQTEQDCFYAKRILCADIYNELTPYNGVGDNPSEISPENPVHPGGNSCIPNYETNTSLPPKGERNSVWYTFTPQESGLLEFLINPTPANADFDYIMYDLSLAPNGLGCAALFDNHNAMIVRDINNAEVCNDDNSVGGGPTGATSSTTGVQYNAPILVIKGHEYVLLVNRFSPADATFQIDFTASEDSIFDTKPPHTEAPSNYVTMMCTHDDIGLVFDEEVDCATLMPSDMHVVDASGTSVSNISSLDVPNCTINGADGGKEVNIILASRLPGPGLFYLVVKTGLDGNTIKDACPSNYMAVGDTLAVLDVACAYFGIDTNVVCTGGPVPFYDSSRASNLGYTYQWTFGDGSPTETASNPSHTYNAAANYTVTQIITDNSVVPPDTSMYSLVITAIDCPLPVADFTADRDTVCAGDSVNFSDQSQYGSVWSWSFPGGTPANSSLVNPTVYYMNPGTYSVTLTLTNATGTDTETKTNYITVLDCNVNFSADRRILCDSGNVQFTDLSGGLPQAWNWTFQNGTPATSSQQNPSVYYSTGGMHDVTLIVTYTTGVSDTLYEPSYITVDTCGGGVFFPTGFNPEGAIPLYKPTVSGEISDFKMSIFNRWGEKLFVSIDPNEGWNGKNNDEFFTPGVYIVYATYSLMSDEGPQQMEYVGTISLVR